MASARKTLAKSLFIMLLENYRNPVSPTVFFRQAKFPSRASQAFHRAGYWFSYTKISNLYVWCNAGLFAKAFLPQFFYTTSANCRSTFLKYASPTPSRAATTAQETATSLQGGGLPEPSAQRNPSITGTSGLSA